MLDESKAIFQESSKFNSIVDYGYAPLQRVVFDARGPQGNFIFIGPVKVSWFIKSFLMNIVILNRAFLLALDSWGADFVFAWLTATGDSVYLDLFFD